MVNQPAHAPIAEQVIAEVNISGSYSNDVVKTLNKTNKQTDQYSGENKPYWIPVMEIDAEGRATIDYKIENKSDKIYLNIQGLSDNGLLGYQDFVIDPQMIESRKNRISSPTWVSVIKTKSKIMKARSKFMRNTGLMIATMLFVLINIFCSPSNVAMAQNTSIHLHFKKTKMKKIDIRFKMINNLMIIPVFINGSDTLHFILDTGVSHTIITSLKGAEGVAFNFSREIDLFGLGSGREVKAFHSFGNLVELPGVIGFNHNVILLKEEFDYLSQGLGTTINGLMGFDVFDSFVVEIDYNSKKVTLYDPKFYKERQRDKMLKKSEIVKMEIIRRKPYINVKVVDDNNESIDANLLVDSGASSAISLFQSSDHKMEIPENSMYSFIGVGLSGDIYGHISRAKRLQIGSFKFKKPLVTYPEETTMQMSDYENDRKGSLGADILNRFTVVFDYHGGEMLIKPNSSFNKEFQYNLSGIDITTPIPDFPLFEISKIRKGSPAWIAGLEEGDQITTINGIETSEYTLSNIVQMLQSRADKKLTVGIQREDLSFSA